MARRFLLHLYMLRIPALILLILGFLLPAAFSSPMFHGLADLESNQIFIVSLAAFLLVSAAMTCTFLVLLYGSERADGKRSPMPTSLAPLGLPERLALSNWIVGILYVVGGIVYVKFLSAVLHTLKAAHIDSEGLSEAFWLRATGGGIVGVLAIVTVFVIDLWLSGPRQTPQIEAFALPIAFVFRESGWLRGYLRRLSDAQPAHSLKSSRLISLWKKTQTFVVRVLGPGYGNFDASGKALDLHPGHGFAGALAILSLLVYLIADAGGHRRLYTDAPFGPAHPYDAVLLQVILLLLLTCWVLSGLSFYFDRFRVPVLLPLALFLFATSQVGSSDHAFHTVSRDMNTGSALPKPKARFASAPDHVIGIAAAGGGIQAAAWTTQVLCGLREEIGPEFGRDILVISGVSGGSVGTMFYLRCLESPDTNKAVSAATNSSLEAIAWGLAHADLRHAILPIQNFWWPGDDRGWALERALRKNAQFEPPDRPLARSGTIEQWPVLLFNSTEARTGDPMVFTNSDFPSETLPAEKNHHLHSFHQEYIDRDVRLETAVRMSAAFPYVSPAARADTPWNAEHLVDGGYFDNSGMFSLGEWLKEAAPNTRDKDGKLDLEHPAKKVLIIKIDAFPDSQWNGPEDHPKSWAYQLIAPVVSVLHVRSEGQLVRGTTGSADLIEVLNQRGHDASAITARYDPTKGNAVTDHPLNCATDPPLTWHLTEVEKRCIQQDWVYLRPDLVARVREFLAAPVKMPPSPAVPTEVRNERLKDGLYIQRMVKH